ncbi:beta-lactamase/transpeptidase-like protein [Leptodontidium sp. MPI-SDFR-AT-0119]|nr:beta-lactamase/transpeptidase-like protein [Leptodontidium sp. MPI-SDFR-AT-0119]
MASFNQSATSLRARFEQEKRPLPKFTIGAINRDSSFHYAEAFGEEVGKPAGTDAVYWIASASKLVTTIAVLQCIEKGQLSLNDDISDVLPEFKDPKILTGFDEKNEAIFKPSPKPVTLRQVTLRSLLTHSSGLSYVFMHPLLTRYQELKKTPTVANRTIAEKFPHQFLVFEPGSQWTYSPGVDWAGLAVERVTSMKLGEYMKRYMFDVVSAKDSTFHPELREELQARKARNWERQGQILKEQPKPVYAENTLDDFGGGGLFTTVDNLLKIYQGVLTGKLLRPETAKQMFQPQLKEKIKGLDNPEEYDVASRNAIWNTVPNDIPVNFGLGGLLNTAPVPKRRGANTITWSGHPNCYWWIDFNNGVAGVYLSQLLPTGDEKAVEVVTEFEEFVYSSLDKS